MTGGNGPNFARLTFPIGEAIIKEGDFGEAAYVIVEGKVAIRIGHFRQNPQTLATRPRSTGPIGGEKIEAPCLGHLPFDGTPIRRAVATASALSVVSSASAPPICHPLQNGIPCWTGSGYASARFIGHSL